MQITEIFLNFKDLNKEFWVKRIAYNIFLIRKWQKGAVANIFFTFNKIDIFKI